MRVPGSDAWIIFLDEDKVYNNSLGEAHMQNLDIGIGMRHFQESNHIGRIGGAVRCPCRMKRLVLRMGP